MRVFENFENTKYLTLEQLKQFNSSQEGIQHNDKTNLSLITQYKLYSVDLLKPPTKIYSVNFSRTDIYFCSFSNLYY